jgi:hypothetical protein
VNLSQTEEGHAHLQQLWATLDDVDEDDDGPDDDGAAEAALAELGQVRRAPKAAGILHMEATHANGVA